MFSGRDKSRKRSLLWVFPACEEHLLLARFNFPIAFIDQGKILYIRLYRNELPMLPPIYRQILQEFSHRLVYLQQSTTDVNPDKAAVGQNFEQARQLFAQKILSWDSDTLDPAIVSPVQSFLTETNRQLRLLGVDITFLAAARQRATQQQRLIQIQSRIETLISYCQAILELGNR
jgi:hypothetical protein